MWSMLPNEAMYPYTAKEARTWREETHEVEFENGDKFTITTVRVYRRAVVAVRLDGEVVLLSETAVPEALHAHLVAPLSACVHHELLKRVRHFFLSLRQYAVQHVKVCAVRLEVFRLRYLVQPLANVAHAQAAAVQMPYGLCSLAL